MSKRTRTIPLAIVAAIVPVIVATAAVSWADGKPMSASANLSEDRALLGIERDSAVEVGPMVESDEKLDAAVSKSAALTAAAITLAPAVRKPAPLPVPVKPKAVAKKTVARTTAKRTSASTSGWKSARVTWYGPGFYGNTMAGGGTLQPSSMIVAHRTLAFGTRIEFKYNGKTCVAVVQDRGPYGSGLVFDLGPGVAKTLGFGGVGTVQYRILSR